MSIDRQRSITNASRQWNTLGPKDEKMPPRDHAKWRKSERDKHAKISLTGGIYEPTQTNLLINGHRLRKPSYDFTKTWEGYIKRLGLIYTHLSLLLKCFSRIWLSATPWTVADQAPLSVGFSRQESWSSRGSSMDQGSNPRLLLTTWEVHIHAGIYQTDNF